MFNEVRSIIAKELNIDEEKIQLDTNLKKDLDADSGTILEIIFELEDKLDVVLPDDLTEIVTTVEDLVNVIENSRE